MDIGYIYGLKVKMGRNSEGIANGQLKLRIGVSEGSYRLMELSFMVFLMM